MLVWIWLGGGGGNRSFMTCWGCLLFPIQYPCLFTHITESIKIDSRLTFLGQLFTSDNSLWTIHPGHFPTQIISTQTNFHGQLPHRTIPNPGGFYGDKVPWMITTQDNFVGEIVWKFLVRKSSEWEVSVGVVRSWVNIICSLIFFNVSICSCHVLDQFISYTCNLIYCKL